MSLKESLIVDWKHKHITYQGCEMFVVDQFEYEGKEYLYVIDKDSVLDENSEYTEIAFLYRVEGGTYKDVEDENLFNELVGKVAGRLAGEKIREILQ